MKKWLVIILLFILEGINSCKPKNKCDCSSKTVCILFVNSSGQSLVNLKLLNHGFDKASVGQVALNEKVCISFINQGENSFNLTAHLENGKEIKSSEVYCEVGYKFVATATKSEIKIDYSNSY